MKLAKKTSLNKELFDLLGIIINNTN